MVIDLMSEPEFNQMRNVLNAWMKKLKSGVEITEKQVEISSDKGEILWQNYHLGKSCPQILLDTIMCAFCPNKWC